MPPSNVTLFRHAAIVACLAIGLNKLVSLWYFGAAALPFLHDPVTEAVMALAGASEGERDRAFTWILALYASSFCLFATTLYMLTVPSIQGRPRRGRAALIAVQLGLALIVDEKLLLLIAAEFALLLQRRPAVAWLVAQMAMATVVHLFRWFHAPGQHLLCTVDGSDIPAFSTHQHAIQGSVELALSLVSQAFAFGIGYLGAAEQRRRLQVAAAHAQLLATEQLLAQTASASERARVARELHDAIGHHLMALKLHLDLALRRAGERTVPASVVSAHSLTQTLLATVRRVVRSEQGPNAGTGEKSVTGAIR